MFQNYFGQGPCVYNTDREAHIRLVSHPAPILLRMGHYYCVMVVTHARGRVGAGHENNIRRASLLRHSTTVCPTTVSLVMASKLYGIICYIY